MFNSHVIAFFQHQADLCPQYHYSHDMWTDHVVIEEMQQYAYLDHHAYGDTAKYSWNDELPF